MLQITIPPVEFWDESNEEFVYKEGATLKLEHSLVSISKWESTWHKPFLSKDQKTYEETIDYVRCMTITQNVDQSVYKRLTSDLLREIYDYINSSMTATSFSENKNDKRNRDIITSEVIYYWMVTLGIPFECERWHLNRLITLVRVCDVKSRPPKKMSRREIMSRNTALNAARRKQFNTKG